MKYLFFLFFNICFFQLNAQEKTNSISGIVLDSDGKTINNSQVTLIGAKYVKSVITNSNGEFDIKNIKSGNYTININVDNFYEYSTDIKYIANEHYNIGNIVLQKFENNSQTVDESNLIENSENETNSLISSLLSSSNNSFLNAANFSLSQGGFSPRGYSNNYSNTIFVNNISMANILRGGDINFNDIGGLNDVLRNRISSYGISESIESFGTLANNVSIDAEAYRQRKGMRITGNITNKNYRNRFMGTYNSGLINNNYAYSVSLSFRGSKEGYIPGYQYESIAGFVSFSKLWTNKLTSSLTLIGNKSNKTVQSTNVQELYDLYGSNYYNGNWGMYKGEIRNGKYKKDFVPIAILSNDYKLDENTNLSLSIGFQSGERNYSSLEYYNSQSPYPTYYKKLPSYYQDNPDLQNQITSFLQNNPEELQLKWDNILQANENFYDSVPTKNVYGKWARYFMGGAIQKINNLNFNLIAERKFNENITLKFGLMASNSLNQQYKQVDDLLGSDFTVNLNSFAERNDPLNIDAVQNNTLNPYEIVYKNGVYGYNFLSRVTDFNSFLESKFKMRHADIFLSMNYQKIFMQRNGYMNVGAYKNNSFGNSKEMSFNSLSFKSGVIFKIDGRNYINVKLAYLTQPPEFNQVYVVNRTSNLVDSNIKCSNITSTEIGYNLQNPKFKFSIQGFLTQSENESADYNYYSELTNNFGTIQLRNIYKRYAGIETSFDIKLLHGFSTNIAANYGDYIFNRRPYSNFYYDNLNLQEKTQTLYYHSYHLSSGPQNAMMIKLNYESKQFWNANLSLIYFDKNYIGLGIDKRTQEAIDNITDNDQYKKITSQEMFTSAFTLDFSFRKSVFLNKYIKNLPRKIYVDFFASVNNILDYQNYKKYGSEQLRFDFQENNPLKFPNKYSYMPGRTYSLNIIVKI